VVAVAAALDRPGALAVPALAGPAAPASLVHTPTVRVWAGTVLDMVTVARTRAAPRALAQRLADQRLAGYLLVLPAVVYVLALIGFPLGLGVWYSLTDTTVSTPGRFVGLGNFVDVAGDPTFVLAVRNTLIIGVVATAAKITLSVMIGYVDGVVVQRDLLRDREVRVMPSREHTLSRRLVLVVLAALLLVLVPQSAALAQPAPTPAPLVAPPGVVVKATSRFDVINAPGQFDRVLLVIDFPPGTWTPPHTHGGYVYIAVWEGEISARMAGVPGSEKKYPVGGTFVETPGEFMEVGNAGTAPARVLATAVLPKGAPLTINQQGVTSQNPPPGPTVVHRATAEADRPGSAFELVQLRLEIPPGGWTPAHVHGGQELVVVTAGETTLRQRGRPERAYGVGESWINPTGLVHAAGNIGSATSEVAATFLLPKGAPLTTVQPAAALAEAAAPAQLPRTGGVGALHLALGGAGLASAAWVLRRRRDR
jgi:LPXTG-motif cell wall-anchored protein